jgi:hypothetical protein
VQTGFGLYNLLVVDLDGQAGSNCCTIHRDNAFRYFGSDVFQHKSSVTAITDVYLTLRDNDDLVQSTSRWRPNVKEGGHDAATVSAKAETTENVTVGEACFRAGLGSGVARCPSGRRILYHRRRARLPPPGPLTLSERSTVDNNGGISLFRVGIVQELAWLIMLAFRTPSSAFGIVRVLHLT